MQAIRFTRAMAPHGVGDTRLVPADVARRLEREGVAELGTLGGSPHAAEAAFVPYAVKPVEPRATKARG